MQLGINQSLASSLCQFKDKSCLGTQKSLGVVPISIRVQAPVPVKSRVMALKVTTFFLRNAHCNQTVTVPIDENKGLDKYSVY